MSIRLKLRGSGPAWDETFTALFDSQLTEAAIVPTLIAEVGSSTPETVSPGSSEAPQLAVLTFRSGSLFPIYSNTDVGVAVPPLFNFSEPSMVGVQEFLFVQVGQPTARSDTARGNGTEEAVAGLSLRENEQNHSDTLRLASVLVTATSAGVDVSPTVCLIGNATNALPWQRFAAFLNVRMIPQPPDQLLFGFSPGPLCSNASLPCSVRIDLSVETLCGLSGNRTTVQISRSVQVLLDLRSGIFFGPANESFRRALLQEGARHDVTAVDVHQTAAMTVALALVGLVIVVGGCFLHHDADARVVLADHGRSLQKLFGVTPATSGATVPAGAGAAGKATPKQVQSPAIALTILSPGKATAPALGGRTPQRELARAHDNEEVA